MNPCETQADGTRRTVCSLCCAQQPMPSLFYDQLFNHDDMPALDPAMCTGSCSSMSYGGDTEHEEQHIDCPLLNSLVSFTEPYERHHLESDDSLNNIFNDSSQTKTEQDYGASSLSMQFNSFGSVVSDSTTYLTCPTITSTPEHDEDPMGTDSFAELISWSPAALHPAASEDDHPRAHPDGTSHNRLAKSMFAGTGNHGFSVDGCVTTHGAVHVLPVDSISGSPGCRTCKGCMRPASACHDHRLRSSSEVADRYKGVKKKKNSDKCTCEIRISRKIAKDSQLSGRDKLWLGTYDTPDQAAQALDVGKYLLSIKKKKKPKPAVTVFDRNTKTILSKFKDHLHAQPLLAEHLESVKKLAKHYGKKGSLYGFSF